MQERSRIPLFPLGIVLCPKEILSLHIFEERYRELIRYCQETDEEFGVVLIRDSDYAEVGCTARVNEIANVYEDGRMDVVVTGQSRFKVMDVHHETSYMTADVRIISEPMVRLDVPLRERAITQHMKLLELAGRDIRPSIYQNVHNVSFLLARDAGLNLEQKQEILELPDENRRINYLVSHFEGLIPQVEKLEAMREKIRTNGHFKELPGFGLR